MTPEAGRATHLERVGDQLRGPAWCCPAPSTVWEREAGPAKPTRCGPGSSSRAQHPQAPRLPDHPSEVAGFISLEVFLHSWARSPQSSSRRALPSVHTLVAELIQARSRTHVAERAPRAPPAPPRPGPAQ